MEGRLPDYYTWFQWPENEQYSLQFMRALGAAQEGAAAVSECLSVAKAISPGNSDSWYAAWKNIGEISRVRADEAFTTGAFHTAATNWLRASHYFRQAEAFLPDTDPRRKHVIEAMKECSEQYLALTGAELVDVDWETGSMQGYFIPAPGQLRPRPTVICISGADVYKDDLLYTVRRSAGGNGLSVLLIDAPGSEAALDHERLPARANVEAPISRWIDYLVTRKDVDPARIAIYGAGLGAAFATRSATYDTRLAAAVCDGGMWDRREQLFIAGRRRSPAARYPQEDYCAPVLCPFLMAVARHDFLPVRDALAVYESARLAGLAVELRVFEPEDTAAAPGHIDNPTLANEFVFDWLREKLNPKRL